MKVLIRYSWLEVIVTESMIGSNMVLEKVSIAGPSNVVTTGRYNSVSIGGVI